jgi:S-adenosylmethionine hydrolase
LDALDKEQINASRTCQQLKSNIRQLEQTRSRLEDGALAKFDEKTSDIRMQAITSVIEFLDHYGNIDTDLNADIKTAEVSDGRTLLCCCRIGSFIIFISAGSLSPDQDSASATLQLQAADDEAEMQKSLQSWNELQEVIGTHTNYSISA